MPSQLPFSLLFTAHVRAQVPLRTLVLFNLWKHKSSVTMVTLSYLLISVVMLHGVHYAYTDDNWDSLLQGTDYRRLLQLYYNGVSKDFTSTTEVPYFLKARENLSAYQGSKVPQLNNWIKQRRPEIENSVVPSGFQYMSGGAGEGKQHLKPEGTVTNQQEVKTDATLPSYCRPPNPCPFGKTAADGCDENIPDTASFNKNYIQRQMLAGYCECDRDHMNAESCAEVKNGDISQSLDHMLDSILDKQFGSTDVENNPYSASAGEKRTALTAKKGSQHIIMKRSSGSDVRNVLNPYLTGLHLPIVAKKSPQTIEPEVLVYQMNVRQYTKNDYHRQLNIYNITLRKINLVA
ncbi:hypothetical protein EB796_024207 [Bugula neritina]|uniref:Neuroendocrine protein 7B2 n=1 Tax=Bugula neritina TaxID=10212 RepID=A0A7J7IVN6_BUGNE|nr:hypothetical protein EB796_024207 [Bugula neritina]